MPLAVPALDAGEMQISCAQHRHVDDAEGPNALFGR